MGHKGLAPSGRTALDERQCRLSLVVLDGIGCHLQGAVDHHEFAQLLGKGGVGVSAFHDFREVEDGGCKIGRSCQAARKGQGHGMCRWIAAFHVPGIVFLSAHAFLRHQVGQGALQACRHGWLMVVDHDVMLGCCLDHLAVVADAVLRLGEFLAVEVVAHISCLHRTDAQLAEPGKGFVHLLLEQAGVAPGLGVSDEAYALRKCIVADLLDVEVGIRLQVTDLFAFAPSGVPSFGQHAAESVSCSEVDVALHVLGGGSVRRSHLPGVLLLVDAPPDAEVSTGFDPRGVFPLAGLVEVEHQARGHQVARSFADDDGTPRGACLVLAIHLHAVLPRCQGCEQAHAAVVPRPWCQVDARIIDEGSLVKGQHQRVLVFDGQWSAHRVLAAQQVGLVDALEVFGAVAGYRPCLGIVCQGDLGQFVHDLVFCSRLCSRQDVAEAYAVVKHAEHHRHHPFLSRALLEVHGQFVVAVHHGLVLAPKLRPRLVGRGSLAALHLDAFAQLSVVEHEAKVRRKHEVLRTIGHLVVGFLGGHPDGDLDCSVG